MPETPAYNTFTAALVSTVLALVLVVGSGRTSTRSSPLIATAVGVALAVLLFVKWPSAVLMTIVVVTLWLALRGFAAGMVALGWSVLGGILILATTVGPVGGFDLGALRRANTASVGSGSSVPSDRFELYLTSVADGVGGLVSGWTVAALVAFVGLFVLSQLAAPRAIAVAAASVAIVGVTFGLVTQLRAGPPASVTELRGEDSLLGAVISPSMLLIPVVGAGSGLLVLAGRRLLARMRARSAGPSGLHEPRRWVPVLAVLGALAVAPAIVSIGTTNPLLSHVLVGAAPLGVLLVIAVATLVAGAPRGAGLAGVGLVLAALLVATQTVNGRIFDPYRGTTTLAGQTAGLSGVAGYEGILVDPEVAQFVDELRSVVRTRTDYEPGDPILAVTRAAGLVSFLEGVPSGPAWLASPHVGQEGNCRRIELASEELEATRLVLVVDDPVAAPLDACLEASFSAWPAGLTEVAVVDYPFGEPTRQGDVVRVYAVR